MRKIKLTFVLLASVCAWTACKKSKSTTPDPVIPRGIHATINGAAWAADTATISYISFGNYVEITGYDSTGKTIDFRINNFNTRGTYNVPQANDSIFFANDYGVLDSPAVATSGTISIQAVNDTEVGGTFSFTANGVTVTGGTFNWRYQ